MFRAMNLFTIPCWWLKSSLHNIFHHVFQAVDSDKRRHSSSRNGSTSRKALLSSSRGSGDPSDPNRSSHLVSTTTTADVHQLIKGFTSQLDLRAGPHHFQNLEESAMMILLWGVLSALLLAQRGGNESLEEHRIWAAPTVEYTDSQTIHSVPDDAYWWAS